MRSENQQTASVPMIGRTRLAVLGTAVLMLLSALAIVAPNGASGKAEIVRTFMEQTTTQAGGHPDVRVFDEFRHRLFPPSAECGCDDARLITVHFPTGFTGNPHAVSKCTFAQFVTGNCSSDAQLGVVTGVYPFIQDAYVPVYNMETHPDQAGLVAFMAPVVNSAVHVELSSRTDSDYGLDAAGEPIYHLLPIEKVDMQLWGVPALHSHDGQRFISPFPSGSLGFCFGPYPNPCVGTTGTSSNLEPVPYLQNPTSCGTPLAGQIDMEWYDGSLLSSLTPWPATTGCDLLSFNPSLTAEPTTKSADTAAGIDISVKVPQVTSPTTPAPSEIKGTTVTLPEGLSINPNAADGKVSCTESEGSFGTREESHCPEHSKIGTSLLDSSALPEPISGAIFLGASRPGDKYRLYLTADGFGTHVKLDGSIYTDPRTGQVKVTFTNLPQAPFSEFNLHFFGSERGLLATPTHCGTYEVQSDFVPWDSVLQEQHTTSYFSIDSGPNGAPCPAGTRPFAPRLEAGTLDNTAGRHSPLVMRLHRGDGDQNITSLDVTTPPGLLATLKGVSYCPESAIATLDEPGYSGLAEMAAAACPASSRIGRAVAETGAGTHPLTTSGQVYLAGPYKGSPLSLVVVVPGVSGPYDLGNVAVRAAIEVDPTSTQITAVSDAVPQILDGIPLRLRSVMIELDRPGFTLNPTDCSPGLITASIHGIEGGAARPQAPFQVSNCATLPFGPKLSLHAHGGVNRRGHPAIEAVFRAKPGEANIRKVSVTLPKGELLDNAHISGPCTRVQFAAESCPSKSILGTARAITPLLDEPLVGNVYLRSSSNKLPDIAIDLEGQIDLELVGRIDSVRGRLRTTFAMLPDAPVSSFELDLLGGRKGLVQNTESLCRGKHMASVKMRGQNGMLNNGVRPLRVSCGKSSSSRTRHPRSAGRR